MTYDVIYISMTVFTCMCICPVDNKFIPVYKTDNQSPAIIRSDSCGTLVYVKALFTKHIQLFILVTNIFSVQKAFLNLFDIYFRLHF